MDKLIYAQLHIVHMTPYAYPVITIRLAQSYAPPIQAIFKSVACPHCIFTYSLFIHSFIHSFDNIYRRKPILDQTMYRNMKSVQRKRNEDKPIPSKSDKLCCQKAIRRKKTQATHRPTGLTQLYKGHCNKHSTITITMQASLHQSNLGQCPYDASHHLISFFFRVALKRAGFGE